MSEATRAKLLDLEKEYARTQKNKATEGHLGLVKSKIAKARKFLSNFFVCVHYIRPMHSLRHDDESNNMISNL